MRIRPVTFDGCAGVLHRGWSDHGVVMLGTLGPEGNVVHRGLYALASMLSRDGAWVLRYDPPGLGQSGGDLQTEDLLESWIESVGKATEFLRRSGGVTTISLVGVRLGATIALLAQSGFPDVERVAVVAPVVRGRSYVRELRMLSAARPRPGLVEVQPASGVIDLAGERVPEPLAADLGRIDLRQLRGCRPEILLIDAERPDATSLADRLRSLDVQPVRCGFPDGPAFLCDALDSTIPLETFETIRSWLHPASSPGPDFEPRVEAAVLEGDRYVERHASFGREDGLLGVLTEPRLPSVRNEVLLFVNTGLTRSSGDGRITVALARMLAGNGIASLRMDVAGIGDSMGRPDRRPDILYDRAAVEDVGEAIDWLQAGGYGRVVLVGTCSGAYLALQSAAADARIRSVVAINLQKFVWRDGMSVRIDRVQSHRTVRSYLRELRTATGLRRARKEWRKAIAIVATAAERLKFRVMRHVPARWGGRSGPTEMRDEALTLLSTLSSRGQRVTLVYSEDDPGWAELTTLFGRRGRDLRALAGVSVRTIAGADHILTDAGARAVLQEMLAAETALLAVAGRVPTATVLHDGVEQHTMAWREVGIAH